MSPRTTLLAAATLALSSFGVACGPDYDHLDISGVVQPSGLSGEVSRSRVVVPAGMVVKAHITAVNDDNDRMSLKLRPVDTSVLEVDPVISDADWAFLGLKEGKTDLEVVADGKRVLLIEAIVSAQPPPQ